MTELDPRLILMNEYVRAHWQLRIGAGAPMAAAQLVAAGESATSVVALAGESKSAPDAAITELVIACGDALNFPRPVGPLGNARVAQLYLRLIAEGAISPYQGARFLWNRIFWELGDDDAQQIGVFLDLLERWKQQPHRRRKIDAEIVAVATGLISDDCP